MAVTETSIANSALIKIGGTRINSINDTSTQAKVAKEQYDKCRDELLYSHPWNFAMKRVSVAADATAPTYGFAYRFALPADCLRVRAMEDGDVIYQVEGRYILTDESGPLNFQYITKITDTAQFSPGFAEALAFRLAMDLAYTIGESNTVLQNMSQLFDKAIKQARSMDAQEGSAPQPRATTWINSRF